MASPTEVPGRAVSETVSPKTSREHIDVGGIRIPLPRWAILCIGFLAILGSGASVYKVWTPPVSGGPVSAASSTPAGKELVQDQRPTSQGNKVSDADMIDYEEALKHADDTPKIDRIILNSPELGTLKVKFFISDRCLLVIRKSAGANPQTTSHYILAAKMEDRAPGKIDHLSASLLQDSTADRDWLETQMQPASYKPTGESAALAPISSCLNPHPGEFRWWNGEQRGCWLQVWRAWPDGCQHYQWFNTCNGYWDSSPNGAPQVYWTNCVH